MPRSRALVLALLLAFSLSGACHRGGGSTRAVVALDGSARIPDDEGVVGSVDRHHLRLAGGHDYPLSPDLQSFNSMTRAAISVLQRKGEYVQVGVDDGTIVWVAAIGAVVPLDRPTVFYQGTVERVTRGRVIFHDGTALRVAPGVTALKGQLVRAELDPSTRQVGALVVI